MEKGDVLTVTTSLIDASLLASCGDAQRLPLAV